MTRSALLLLLGLLLCVADASAQSPQTATPPPAQAPPPAAEFPIVRVGMLSYLQYNAELKNRNGANAFDVTRAYLNINGQLAPRVRFRFLSSALY